MVLIIVVLGNSLFHLCPGVPGVGRPAVGPQHSGMMGQMGSELESRLNISEERRGKVLSSFEDQGQVSRGKKSAAPAAPGIKFNERAEVVEVEVKSETERYRIKMFLLVIMGYHNYYCFLLITDNVLIQKTDRQQIHTVCQKNNYFMRKSYIFEQGRVQKK